MAGLFSYFAVGIGLLLIGLLETLNIIRPSPPLRHLLLLTAAALAAVSLPSAGASAMFLLFSAASAVGASTFPPPLLDLLLSFAFAQELLHFYLPRRYVAVSGGSTDGVVEGRFYDLLLVPVLICVVASVTASVRPRSLAPRIVRALGLVLQGSWFVQMGFSFFTTAISNGCSIEWIDGSEFTIVCADHQGYHRGGAIATLLFNCHLAAIVVIGVLVYGAVERQIGSGAKGYRPLSRELKLQESGFDNQNFSLVSDEDDSDEIRNKELGRKGGEDFVLTVKEGNAPKSSH